VYVDPASNLVLGAEPDMIAEAAKRLGIRAFTYHRVPFTARVPQLLNGQCDVFLSGIGVSGVRARWTGIKFTAPYRMNQPVVVVPAASRYQSVADLRGAVLAGWTGSDALDYAHQLAPTLGGGTTVLEVAEENDVYKALSSGAAAAYIDHIYNVPPAESAHGVRALPDVVRLVPLNTTDDESPYRYGALGAITRTEDRDLNLALSIAFAEMIADGAMSRILQKWNVDSQLAFELIRPEAR
jgi:ABC-type amino acid transport substrate-binding protein